MNLDFFAGPLAVQARGSASFLSSFKKLYRPALVRPEEAFSTPDVVYVEDPAGGVVEASGGTHLDEFAGVEPSAWSVDGYLLREFPRRLGHLVSLHAAAVVWGPFVILFVAQSGGGKSTMTLQALRNGARYLTDDACFVSRRRMWGYARAIRFEAMECSVRMPSYVDEFDTSLLSFEQDGRRLVMPIWCGAYSVEREISLEDFSMVVVGVTRSDRDEVVPSDRVRRLSLLYSASILSHRVYGGEIDRGPTFELMWRDPQVAWSQLVDRLVGSLGLPEATPVIRR